MTNKLKIKLTKEQVDNICRKITFAGTSVLGLTYKNPKDLVVEISEDQIVKEKSNVEKWGEITRPFLVRIMVAKEMFKNRTSCKFLPPPDYKEMEELNKSVDTEIGILNEFLSKHYNADAAYKEVIGGE